MQGFVKAAYSGAAEIMQRTVGKQKKINIRAHGVIAMVIIGIVTGLFVLLAALFIGHGTQINAISGSVGMDEADAELNQSLANGENDTDNAIPVSYNTINTKIHGLEQVINIIEIDPASNRVKIKPVLSYDRIFGFEFLSKMFYDHEAYAAVNGGFFYEYGNPSGMVVIDGEVITASTGKYPVFVVNNGKAELKEIKTDLWLKSNKAILKLDSINTWSDINTRSKEGGWVVFTPKYGTSCMSNSDIGNNIENNSGSIGKEGVKWGTVITITVGDNIITEILNGSIKSEIPANGMLIIYVGNNPVKTVNMNSNTDNADDKEAGANIANIADKKVKEVKVSYIENAVNAAGLDIPFEVGERVELLHSPEFEPDGQAYECGSWIIKDGKIVIGDSDCWVGVLTNRDPRTAIGIKQDGKVVLVTVDGRQPGYSYGLTGQELGEFLLDYGVMNAAMLDGGASTEMIIEGKIVNRPSYKGTERPLAGGLFVYVQN